MNPVIKNQLKNLRLDSVDLCQRGANQFADVKLFKSEDGGPEVAKKGLFEKLNERFHRSDAQKMEEELTPTEQFGVMKSALSTSLDSIAESDISGNEKVDAIIKSVGEFTDCVDAASLYWLDSDEMVEKQDDPKGPPEDEGSEDKKEEKEGGKMAFGNFDVSKMSEEDRASYDALKKKYCGGGDDKPVEKHDDGKMEMMNPVIEKALKDVAAMQDELMLRDMLDIAKSYECIGQEPEALAKTLLDLKKSDQKEAYDQHIALLDQVKTVYDSNVFKTFGSDFAKKMDAASPLDTAISEIMKSEPDLSYAEATVKAYEQNPDIPEYI